MSAINAAAIDLDQGYYETERPICVRELRNQRTWQWLSVQQAGRHRQILVPSRSDIRQGVCSSPATSDAGWFQLRSPYARHLLCRQLGGMLVILDCLWRKGGLGFVRFQRLDLLLCPRFNGVHDVVDVSSLGEVNLIFAERQGNYRHSQGQQNTGPHHHLVGLNLQTVVFHLVSVDAIRFFNGGWAAAVGHRGITSTANAEWNW